MQHRRQVLAGAVAAALAPRISLGLEQAGRKAAYPRAIDLAGARAAYDLRTSTGWREPPAKTVGVTSLVGTGFSDNGVRLISMEPGAVLEGWDTGGRFIVLAHDRCVVRDSRVWIAGRPSNGIWVSVGQPVDNTLVEYNELDGRAEAVLDSGTMMVGIQEHGKAQVVNSIYRGNYIHHIRGDGMTVRGGGALVELNRFMIGGWGSKKSHFDALDIWTMNNERPSTIQDNWFDLTPEPSPAGTFGRTSCITLYNCNNGVVVRRNVIGCGAREPDNGFVEATSQYRGGTGRSIVVYSSGSINKNINFLNNVFDYLHEGGGPFHPNARNGINLWSNNYRLRDAAPIPNPGKT